MSWILAFIKFLIKIRIVGPLRSFFLLIFGASVNANGRDKRMLIINLEALGDLIVFTSVLKHYKRRFPDKKIYLLIKSGLGIERIFKGEFADEVILLKYRRFAVDPLYSAKFINSLRRIGFGQVINHDFSVAEPFGKIIAVNLGAQEVIGYEGMGLEYRIPFDIQQKKTIFYVVNRVFPRYTKLIPRIDRGMPEDNVLPSAISHYIAIYEGATGYKESDYRTTLGAIEDLEAGEDFLRKLRIKRKKYAVVNFGASVSYKRWPAKKFAETLNFFDDLNLPIVLVGSASEQSIAREFTGVYRGRTIDLIGKTSFSEFLELVRSAFFVFANDSATAHVAVAVGTPSLCVSGGGQFGMFQDYGVPEINRWVYKKTWCYGDNWHCGKGARRKPSPCLEGVSVEDARKELASLLDHLKGGSKNSAFRLGRFLNETSTGDYKIKIVYTGMESENYSSARRPSFEYGNFYLSLKNFPGVKVIEYPYEPIVTVGKAKFNKDLLDLVRREKPDLFFAFMFTDELDPRVLDEIKKLTKSVAWFADDHWRIWNYSRHYAPHFSWVVTTWSKAPEVYARYGIKNVIRSQWACNIDQWKPVEVPRDIDVAFVGQYNPARAKIIRALKGAEVDVWVKGFGWPEGRLPQEEVVRSFSRTKINLNFNAPPSRWNYKMLGRLLFKRSRERIVPSLWNIKDNFISWYYMKTPQIKARPFEILGCKTFLISACADDMDKYYEDGKEIVYYDGTIADLVQKIKYYLAHDEERERIARAGYERTIREHTYEKRFMDIFRNLGLNYISDK